MNVPLFFIFLLILSTSFGQNLSKSNDQKESITNKILVRYATATGVKAQFTKTDFKKTLGLKNTAKGTMLYADGKINIILSGEKKSEIIYNGASLWIIEYPDLDFNPKGHRKVTEINDHKPALAQQIVGLFQHPTQFFKNFKTISKKNSGKITTFRLESKDKAIQNFGVEFNTHKMLIKSIQFTDDVQTETRIEFVETKFLKTAPEGIFNYKRKKDDEVM